MVGFMTGLIFSKDSHFITVHNLISQAKISHFFFSFLCPLKGATIVFSFISH